MNPTVSKLPANAKVAVVGGGVSGLTFAYFLSKLRPDIKVTIYESKDRCGGWIHSDLIQDRHGDTVMVEKGPRTLRGVSDGTVLIVETLRDLGKEDVVQYIASDSDANKKFLLDKSNVLTPVPQTILGGIKFMMGPLGKGFFTGLIGEPFRPAKTSDADESAQNLLRRRFGNDHLSHNVFSAIFHGIYAGDIKSLSAKRTLGKMVLMEKKNGSLMKTMINNVIKRYKSKDKIAVEKGLLSQRLKHFAEVTGRSEAELVSLSRRLKKYPMLGFKTGLECYPKTLYEYLTGLPNVDIRYERVNRIKPAESQDKVLIESGSAQNPSTFDHVRSTVNPDILADVVPFEALAKKLREVKANTVILVNFYLPNKDIIPTYHGFGYLVPQCNNNHENLLGVIFDSVIEQNFKPLFSKELPKNPEAKQYTKLTAMIGGHYLGNDGSRSIPSNSIIINSVKNALQNHLHINEQDLKDATWDVTVVKDCLPQYHVGYDDWLAEAVGMLQKNFSNNVSLGGMAFSSGPGVPTVIEDAFEGAYALANTKP